MIRNYVKVVLRNLVKQKVHAAINVFGLAIGIACCVLIYLFVRDEMSYDRFHTQKDRIYCAIQTFTSGEGQTFTASIPNAGGPALKDAFEHVEDYARIWTSQEVVRCNGILNTEQLKFVDPSLLSIFTFPLISGNPQNALSDPSSVVITETVARRYFGTDDPLGQTMSIKLGEKFQPFTVSGVARDVPANSSIRFGFLLPMERACDVAGDGFLSSRNFSNSVTYLLFRDKDGAAAVAAQMSQVMAPIVDTSFFKHALYPLTSLHLDKSCMLVTGGNSDALYSFILTGLGLLVLLIACFNFMNLSIARSSMRVKEIGVRQVIGAHRRQLLGQFWSEGLILSAFALGIGIVLAELFLPMFNALTGKQLALDYQSNGMTILALAGICLFAGLVAGSYPAIILSRLRPVQILTRRFRIGGGNIFTRSLVVAQFAASVFLLTGAIIMTDQLSYLKNKNLGFHDEQLLFVRLRTADSETLLNRYANEIRNHSSILGITGTDAALGGSYLSSCTTTSDGQEQRTFMFRIDCDYLKTVGVNLREGRNFSPDIPSDKTQSVLVNETLVRQLNLDNPVGSALPFCLRQEPSTIIGVVDDFHYMSMKYPIDPIVFHMDDSSPIRYLNIRISPEDMPSTLDFLRQKWAAVAGGLPFEYSFVDEQLDSQYIRDERWNTIITYAAITACLISCLGLVGLSALAAGRRAREIGIRKIHGASVTRIIRLFNREFILLVSISTCIAWPVAWWAANRWLEDFAYRISVGPLPFIVAFGLVLAVALVSVCYQVIRAALTNPVDVLKYE